MFFTEMPSFSCNALKCVSMNNIKNKIRSEIDINSNKPTFYPYSINIQINVMAGLIISIILKQHYVF